MVDTTAGTEFNYDVSGLATGGDAPTAWQLTGTYPTNAVISNVGVITGTAVEETLAGNSFGVTASNSGGTSSELLDADGITIGSGGRSYLTFNGTDSYGSVPALTAAGDFVLEFGFITTQAAHGALVADNHVVSYYIAMDADAGDISFWALNVEYKFIGGVSGGADGLPHIVRFVLTGTTLELFYDAVSQGAQTITLYTGANNFLIASSNSLDNPFNGVVFDVNFESGWTQTGNATGNPFYPIDDVSTTTIANSNGPDGDGTLTNVLVGDWS